MMLEMKGVSASYDAVRFFCPQSEKSGQREGGGEDFPRIKGNEGRG